MKKFFLIISVIIFAGLCAGGCAKEQQPEEPFRNENFGDHTRILLYEEGNVPYDSEKSCRDYVFITPYLAEYPTGGAVLVFPGGGYSHLSNSSKEDGVSGGRDNDGEQREASDIAAWYNEAGISVFVVNYRTTAVDSAVNYRHLLSDGARAVRYVRAHAGDFFLKENQIAVQGYSAGGHLAAMLCTQGETEWQADDGEYTPDSIDSVSSRPDAGILCYALTSLTEGKTHTGAKSRFGAGVSDNAFFAAYSAENRITDKTCPFFIWHEKGDTTVPCAGSEEFAYELMNAGIECELHLFNDAGSGLHGIGAAQAAAEARVWPSLATEFLLNVFGEVRIS